MNAGLRVLRAGPGITIQDAGRWGYLRYGVTPAGPMDVLAHEAANLAAGGAAGAAALEISVGGLDVVAEGAEIWVAIVSSGFRIALDGMALPGDCIAAIAAGHTMSIRAGAVGAWAYLAPFGRIDARAELGSLSMHVRSGMGGGGVRAGDLIALAEVRPGPSAPQKLAQPHAARETPIRFVAGPQDDYFDAANVARFLEGPWRISARSDRMAYALEGPRIVHAKGFNIVSDGVAFGAIQIPGDGLPLVQMADRAPTGGYPKIGTVIAADLGRFAQMRPGASLRFVKATVEQAVEAWRAARADMIGALAAPHVGPTPSSESLLAQNLVGGVVSAQE